MAGGGGGGGKPPAKRPRKGTRGAVASEQQGAGPEPGTGQEDDDAGVVAKMRVHKSVLAGRSDFFEGMLLGGGSGMREGREGSVTVELEGEQGQLVIEVFESS